MVRKATNASSCTTSGGVGWLMDVSPVGEFNEDCCVTSCADERHRSSAQGGRIDQVHVRRTNSVKAASECFTQ